MGLFTLLAFAFIVAKVTGWLVWSWWWLPVIFLGDILIVAGMAGLFATVSVIISFFRKMK